MNVVTLSCRASFLKTESLVRLITGKPVRRGTYRLFSCQFKLFAKKICVFRRSSYLCRVINIKHMANVPLITAWEDAIVDHRCSSFETTFTFNGNTIHATGFYSFDGYDPNITDIAFLDSEFLAPEIGVAHEKDLRAEIEVELRERYQVEMYAEWERFNGPDEHGDY